MMKTEKDIRTRIRDLELMTIKDPKNKRLYDVWQDALLWVLDEIARYN